jgi:tol-pal system protein YbgF
MAGLLVAGLPAPSYAQQSGDSVASRLGRLEEKVRDLQVTIGTLQSFISTKPGATWPQEALPSTPQPSDMGLGPRIDALETQITALTSHIEQIGKQMSALEAKLSAFQVAPAPTPFPQDEPPPLRPSEPPMPQAEPPPLRQGEAPIPSQETETAAVGAIGADDDENFDPSKPRWYGPKPGSDALAALLQSEAGSEPTADDRPQNLLAALPGGDAQTLYQQGYGALLQKDYAGAEDAFRQLVDTYPNDPLAGDAQYWIGESYYVRGQYKNAADAFLHGYKKYKKGQKAPDTLLKLGMSLAELGQKEAACSTFNELKAKFPQAPQHIGEEAKFWRKKAGC